jgi:hypothetical protein
VPRARGDARQEHPRLLDRQLSLDAWQASFKQVVDLGPETPCDQSQHAGRRLVLAELDLAQKGPGEIGTPHAGQAHPTVSSDPADAVAEGFVFRHCKLVLYR